MDDFWAKVFPDQPVPDTSLQKMHNQIMQEIMAQPQNFGEEMELERRRKLGLLWGGAVLALGFGALLLLWVNGASLWAQLEELLFWTAEMLHPSWFGPMWNRIEQVVLMVDKLRLGLETVLAGYRGSMLGLSMLVLLLVSEARQNYLED